jgi:2-iminobutanoate/2-iminopropanoate deaminase
MRDKVVASAAPAPVGPYSQAVQANGFIFASGQIPLDPVTQEIVLGGITRQTEQVLRAVARMASESDQRRLEKH